MNLKMTALMPPFQVPLSLSYLQHTRKETYHLRDLTMYYTLSLKTIDLSPRKSMKKWLESYNLISLTTWFCRARLLVCGQQMGSFPNESTATNHAHESPYTLLSTHINKGRFHVRGEEKKPKKNHPSTNFFLKNK